MVDRSLPQLTSDLAAQVGDLFRNEVRLARVEAVQSVKGLAGGLVKVGIGAALGMAAATVGLFALVYVLAYAFPLWVAALISAIIGGGAGYMLVRAGVKAFSENKFALPRTQQQIAQDVRTIKEKVNS
jgi:Putative Actinobacterial Holin-X, holin superfamily III